MMTISKRLEAFEKRIFRIEMILYILLGSKLFDYGDKLLPLVSAFIK